MNSTWIDLAGVPLDGALCRPLEAAALAIGRLDARLCASFCRDVWHHRSFTTGLAASLTSRGLPLDEIDLFAAATSTPLPRRRPSMSADEAVAMLTEWRDIVAGSTSPYWRDLVVAPLDLPGGWVHRPALLQALALAAHHAHIGQRSDWPVLPQLLHALGITRAVLPSLAVVDRAWLTSPRDHPASARRMVRVLTAAADAGLKRLHRMELDHVRAERALAAQTRAGALRKVVALAGSEGVLVPRRVAIQLKLSISGAGKLLARAATLGLLIEVSGRSSWRAYLVPDLARQFGYVKAARGRSISPAKPAAALDKTLADFDAEMAAIDAMLATHGSTFRDPPE